MTENKGYADRSWMNQSVLPSTTGGYYFPVKELDIKQPGQTFQEKRLWARKQRIKEKTEREKQEEQQKDAQQQREHEEQMEQEQDEWKVNHMVLTRIHRKPRSRLFVPEDGDCPIPLKYLEYVRTTETTMDTREEKRIYDVWNTVTMEGAEPDRELSGFWTGTTTFDIKQPQPQPGYTIVQGRPTKVRADSQRVPYMRTEEWERMSKKDRRNEKQYYESIIKPMWAQAESKTQGYSRYIPSEQMEEYKTKIKEAQEAHPIVIAPAMICRRTEKEIARGSYESDTDSTYTPSPDDFTLSDFQDSDQETDQQKKQEHKPHQESIGDARMMMSSAFTTKEYFALVHKPISINQALRIPAAKASIDKEWKKLEDLQFVDMDKVREKSDVAKEAKKDSKIVHFGALMQLCHLRVMNHLF